MVVRTFALWSLQDQAYVESRGSDLVVHGRFGTVLLPSPGPVVAEALRRMQLGPVLLENVAARGAADPSLEWALWRLHAMVVCSLGHELGPGLDQEPLRELGAGPLLSVDPVHRLARFRALELPLEVRVQISRSASVHSDGRNFVLASPSALHRVLIHLPQPVWVLSMLGRPTTSAQVLDGAPLPAELTRQILAYLAGTRMIVPSDG